MNIALVFFVIIALLLVFFVYSTNYKEAFGTSPGTLVQLSASHVPTSEDESEERVQRELVSRDIHDMTETGYGDY
jgi:hypothetical protein